MNFNVRLTDKELDYVANVLAQRPWQEVNVLLENIKGQVDMQQKLAAMPKDNPVQEIRPNGHDTQPVYDIGQAVN